MKVAMIGHKRIPSREGGVEIVVEEIATRLAGQGYKIDVYNRKGKCVMDRTIEMERFREYKGIRIKNVFTFENKKLNALVYSFLATICAVFHGYDVIHYHAEGPSVMLIIPHLLGIRTVVTIHGLDWQRSKWGGFASRYIKLGEKIAARYADQIIVLSHSVRKYFMDEYGRETCYIPNGVNVAEARPADIITREYGLHKDDYILYLGRLVPEKGIHYLIEAYKKTSTDKKLVIAGGSSHTEEYEQELHRLAADDDRIIFTGFVQGEKLEELFSNCLAYTLPSDVEGMPISLLEAVSYGRQCLVSDIKEIEEVLGEDGWYFEHGNVNSLQRTLEKMLSELKESAFTLPSKILRKHDWDDIVGAHMNLYEMVAHNGKLTLPSFEGFGMMAGYPENA